MSLKCTIFENSFGLTHGALSFTVVENIIVGGLNLPGKSVWRKVSAASSPSCSPELGIPETESEPALGASPSMARVVRSCENPESLKSENYKKIYGGVVKAGHPIYDR